MMEVMVQLIEEGHNYEFYIYGHGQLKEYIINYIELNKAHSYIYFMGELEYKNLFSVLKDAFMFIGMGTVHIEASSMGVPALQGIDSETEQVSYGFFSSLKGLSIGEVNENFLKVNMKDSILELAAKNEQEYYEFALAQIRRANIFNIDEVIKQYYNFIKNASTVFDVKLPTFKFHIVKILRQFYKFRVITKIEHRNM